MEVTLIKGIDWRYDLYPWIQHLAQTDWIAKYRFANISEETVNKIRDAATEEVQAILSKLY